MLAWTTMPLVDAKSFLLLLIATSGCVPGSVIGPLQNERDARDTLMTRARRAGVPEHVMNTVVPPLTPEEEQSVQAQNSSCRSSYLWKNTLTWTGGAFVGAAAGMTIGAAFTSNNNDTAPKVLGVSAGSLAALGSIFVAVGGIIQQGFTDRGCRVR
jgi:hypothetical protein